jgi:hypothetical protein
MKYIVKLNDGRELEATRNVSEGVCPEGLLFLKQDSPYSKLNISMPTGGEVKTTFDNLKSIEIIFEDA